MTDETRELYCEQCRAMTSHRFRWHVMSPREEYEAEEQMLDEWEGLEGYGMHLAMRSSPARKLRELWARAHPTGSSDEYQCAECGGYTKVA